MNPTRPSPDLERLMVDTVRVLSMDAVQKANSGHPGTPMALAPLGYEIFTRHLRHDPADPAWIDRDRFVLSCGHASMLLYSLLHLTGYDLSLEELRNFRQWGSKTAGHPEVGHTPGVETTTGPLGQGVTNSVGMAVAERWLAARFNRPGHSIIDHWTYAVCSDGDLMEGVSHEAADFAGHQKLGKLIWVFDDNKITIEGSTDLAFTSDQAKRFEGYGWHVQRVDDGNDLEAIDAALQAARAEINRPSFVILRTTIAWGSPGMAGHHDAHGAPLGEEEVAATRENLGWSDPEAFGIPERAREAWRWTRDSGAELTQEWKRRFEAYRDDHPEEARELLRMIERRLPDGWADDLPSFIDVPAMATRAASGKVLQGLAKGIPELVGGSADLSPSNKTDIAGADGVQPDTPGGRILHFGVREHAMGGIMNGMALHGGPRPFGGTFLIFSDYMRPSVRLASMMGQPVVYVYTHDSIGLGEDGPTHQPVEQVMTLRAIPGLMDLRPADPAETRVAWQMAVERTDGPAFLALTRQGVPTLSLSDGTYASAEGVRQGGYILIEAEGGEPQVILMASGSEVGIALEARGILQERQIPTRVVSLPSWYLFQRQDRSYRESVLPASVTARVSVEAGTTLGWERWTGPYGASVGIDRFGASAPWKRVYQELGITPEAVVEAAIESLDTEARVGAPA